MLQNCIQFVVQCVVMLSQDSFYRGLTPEELADVACECLMQQTPGNALSWVKSLTAYDSMQNLDDQHLAAQYVALSHSSPCLNRFLCCTVAAYNFDHPDSIDNTAVVSCLDDLKVSHRPAAVVGSSNPILHSLRQFHTSSF